MVWQWERLRDSAHASRIDHRYLWLEDDFYILLVISFVALILTGVSFRDVLDNEKIPFDILSFLLCGVGFGGILLGLGNMGTLPMTSGFVLLPLLCGIAACIAFVWRQLHMGDPIFGITDS